MRDGNAITKHGGLLLRLALPYGGHGIIITDHLGSHLRQRPHAHLNRRPFLHLVKRTQYGALLQKVTQEFHRLFTFPLSPDYNKNDTLMAERRQYSKITLYKTDPSGLFSLRVLKRRKERHGQKSAQ
jgi:hypothetical protein